MHRPCGRAENSFALIPTLYNWYKAYNQDDYDVSIIIIWINCKPNISDVICQKKKTIEKHWK